MKKYILTMFALSVCSTNKPMLFQENKNTTIMVILADRVTLKERLTEEGYRGFCRDTRIYRNLGAKKLPLSMFVQTVFESVESYNTYNASLGWSTLSVTDRSKIMRAMLHDNPHAIISLEQKGMLK